MEIPGILQSLYYPAFGGISMFIRNWKTDVFTIPNLLSLLRLLLLPVYVRIYLTATEQTHYLLAGCIMALSCLTDLLDGLIARHWNQITNLGKILDPLADKVTQFTLTLCLALRYPVLKPVLALFLVKEVFQAAVGIAFLTKGQMLDGALPEGKLCTVVLFISLIGMVLFPGLNQAVVDAIAAANSFFLAVSFLSYGRAYFGRIARVQDL
jgi:cardiolipin synthase